MPAISNKTNIQKLLVKSGYRFLVLNPPLGYLNKLGELPANVTLLEKPSNPLDMIQLFVANRKELESILPNLRAYLTPKIILWVTYHKGTSKTKTDINRDSIWAYGKTIGLEAVALISIDDDWSALRLKIA